MPMQGECSAREHPDNREKQAVPIKLIPSLLSLWTCARDAQTQQGSGIALVFPRLCSHVGLEKEHHPSSAAPALL